MSNNTIQKAKEYWEEKEEYKSHGNSIHPNYHEYRLGKVKALIDGISTGNKCVDVGCGEGDLVVHCKNKGWEVEGFDISEKMVESAKEKLSGEGINPSIVYQGGIESLREYDDDSVDLLLAINVLTYLDKKQDEEFYEQAERIVRPEGTLIIAHSNELFDIFTFNKYTVEFFENTLLPLTMDDEDKIQEATEKVEELISHSNKPDEKSKFASERDKLNKRRENPLTYENKLESFDFSQEELIFTHHHAVPPLLIEDNAEYKNHGKMLEEINNNPYAPIMASIFISKSKKC
jgi:ubiquinone/menaquinone biosynthesis C-methylase UbiE